MKHYSILFGTLCLVASSYAATLLPTDFPSCAMAEIEYQSCDDGMLFVADQFGRCGCLEADELFDLATCRKSKILCKDEEGEIYSKLFMFKESNNSISLMEIGCGCYETKEPGIRDS